jgi:hypothetical protein
LGGHGLRRKLVSLAIRCLTDVATTARQHIDRLPESTRLLSCSEFIARCILAAGLPVDVRAPLNPDQIRGLAGFRGDKESVALRTALEALANTVASRRVAPMIRPVDGLAAMPETITPGDLLVSPSLQVAAVFVPSPGAVITAE